MSWRRRVNSALGWLGPDRTIAERAAFFAAAAVVGESFEPGLQPRKTVHQAIATGVLSAVTLTTVSATQGVFVALGRAVTGGRTDASSKAQRLAFGLGTNLGFAAVAAGVARAIPAREDERARRGLLRVAAERSARVALIGASLTAVLEVGDAIAETSKQRWLMRLPVALLAGVGLSAWQINRTQERMALYGDETMHGVSPMRSVALSLGVGAGILGLQAIESGIARTVAVGTARIAPRYDVVANPIGHVVSLGALAGGLYLGYEYAVRRVEQGGAAIEPAYMQSPTSPAVSGSPESLVPFDSLSREGRRFVNMALTPDEIADVMGEPAVADPIRIFVGLESAPTVDDRLDVLFEELIRTGAFDREVLVLASPTGSGYINYVFAETLEFLTRGNCAIATMQYSMLPSSMSLTRTALGIEQNRSAIQALSSYLEARPKQNRPRLVLFGESLGAQTLLDVWRHRTVTAIDRDHVFGSLFLGTPSATQFAKAWRRDPDRVDPQGHMAEVDDFAEYQKLPDVDRVRHVLLTHHDDPIPKFGINVLMRQPAWLGPVESRPPGIPKSTRWRPTSTFVLTAVDMVNAMDVQPGQFGRRGHDYREDIASFVSAVYDLPVDPDRLQAIEERLRARELHWAQRRLVAEQVSRAKEAVIREFRQWGISPDAALTVMSEETR
jgi:uncharacterized membrane protein